MDKKYISTCIRTSGPVPRTYSMLSLGACIVGDISRQFYREITPLHNGYEIETIKNSSLGLMCLEDIEECNPHNSDFNPAVVLELLSIRGKGSNIVMKDYHEWILESTKGHNPVEASALVSVVSGFTGWYFNKCKVDNPFGDCSEDMDSFYRGVIRNPNASMDDLNMRNEKDHFNNALEDAIQQAKEFEEVLRIMKST